MSTKTKPLTSQKRREYERAVTDFVLLAAELEPNAEGFPLVQKFQQMLVDFSSEVAELLATEAYWRDAVKKAKPKCEQFYDSLYALCPWCECDIYGGIETAKHGQECPWLLAQDE